MGIAGRAVTEERKKNARKKTGLFDRLRSHASGRRSGDQFCIYVFDRLVLSTLSAEQIQEADTGQLSLDKLTGERVRTLSYRFIVTETYAAAMELERTIQAGQWPAGAPLLNARD